MYRRLTIALAAFAAVGAAAEARAGFIINTSSGFDATTYRGSANTTYLGWDTFDDPNFAAFANDVVINDNTPDLGTYAGSAALIKGNTANDHISSSGNIYTAGTSLNETMTAPTAGTPATGFTTIIVQGVTAFGPFSSAIGLSAINGVSPTIVQGTNSLGNDQFWAKYQIPGNAATYDFTMSGDPNTSISQLIIDTQWSSAGYATDTASVPEPSIAGLALATGIRLLGKRRRHAIAE